MFLHSSLLNRGRPLLPALPGLIFLSFFFAYPVLKILTEAVFTPDAGISLKHFIKIADNAVYAKVLTTTFLISFITALSSVVLGYPVAYFLNQLIEQSRGRWIIWLLIPFWTSYLVKTFAWILFLSRSGILGNLSILIGITRDPVSLVPSITAVLICMVHGMLPLAVMTMLPIMQSINKQFTQAAETLGANHITSFITVFLPLSAPGAAAGGLLVFITSLGFFITPALLGTPSETMVAQLVITAVLELLNMPFAAALSVPLLLSAIVVFIAFDRLVGLSALGGEAKVRPARRFSSTFKDFWFFVSRVATWLFAFNKRKSIHLSQRNLKVYVILILMMLLLPIAIVFPIAFTSSSFLAFPPTGFSLKWFETFIYSPIWQVAIVRSLSVATVTGVLALAFGLGTSLCMVNLSPKWSKLLFSFSIAPLIVPRIVIAIGLFYLYAKLQLVGTDLGLIIGHTVLSIPYVVVTMSATLKGFDWRLIDAARILGASFLDRLRTILIPLLFPGLVSSFLFSFITSFDELTIAIFVSGGLKTTLPKQMWDDVQLQVNPTLAAVSTVMVVVISISLIVPFMLKNSSKKRGKNV